MARWKAANRRLREAWEERVDKALFGRFGSPNGPDEAAVVISTPSDYT